MSTVRSIERRLYARREDDRESRLHSVAAMEAVGTHEWGAIWAGYMVEVGVAILLLALVFGIGFSTLNPMNPASWSSMGKGVGIWAVVVSLIALFLGSITAGRAHASATRHNGIARGITLWGLSLGTMLVLALWIGSTAATAAASAVGHVAAAAPPTVNGGTAAATGSGVSWGIFWYCLIGLGCGILGGAIGANPGMRRGKKTEAPAPAR